MTLYTGCNYADNVFEQVRMYCTSAGEKSDQNRQGIIYRHTRQRVRGGEDTGKVNLRTLNYLPNDDVKPEHSQYMCNICAEILLEYRELVVLIKATSVLGYIYPKNKKDGWNSMYATNFECI